MEVVDNSSTSGESRGQVEKFKVITGKLLNDVMDHFQVMELARSFSVNLSGVTSFSRKKSLLLKFVLEQILKSEPNNAAYYRRLLEEANRTIGVQKSNLYFCCLVGCLYTAEWHRNYIQHLKTVHHTYDKLNCNFMHQCSRQFKSISLLLRHIRECHSVGSTEAGSQVVQDISCRCDLSSCHGQKFRSVAMLMTHVNTFHAKEERNCIFDQCNTRFSAGSNSRNHFRIKHKLPNNFKLKEKHILDNSKDSSVIQMEVETTDLVVGAIDSGEVQDEYYEEHDLFAIEDDDALTEVADTSSDYFMMQYADFLNKLTHLKYIPQKTVTEIADEYRMNSMKARDVRERKLRNALRPIPSMTEEQVEEIVKESIVEDDYLKAQNELNTEYKRNKFIQQNFKYVAPVEVVLNENEVKQGSKKDVVHYIPIKESLRNLLEYKSLKKVFEQEREQSRNDDGVLRDFRDGSAYLESNYFKNNPGAYAAHFYSDGVELSNPLGAAKGRHKIVQVFYTLCQIPKSQRSQIDRMQLCMVFKEKLVRLYGYDVIFKWLIKDLKDLEVGLTVSFPTERIVQMGVLAYSSDNLEAHLLGKNTNIKNIIYIFTFYNS